MVGIGGGAPTLERDIRLGDVVVSTPHNGLGGVVQYDIGKLLPGGRFKQTGQLNAPPEVLLGVLPELQRRQNDPRKPDRLAEHLQRMEDMRDYQRPNHDRLYRTDYSHQGGGKNCDLCGTDKLVQRPERQGRRAVTLHYGTIASGNSVIEDAMARDRYANDPELNILCFEMEAAGLMNNLPCLIIRGVCDYSDSHKNDDWHKYAALTAAAYARELLLVLKPTKVDVMPPWVAKLDDVAETVVRTNAMVESLQQRQRVREHQAILDWLTPIDYSSQQDDFIARRQEGTGEWLLSSNEFKLWLEKSNLTLFCPGIPGAGKTIITSIVINHLHNEFRNDPTIGIAYLYCNYRQQHEQKPIGLVLSLLKQLLQEQRSIPEGVRNLYMYHSPKKTRPLPDEILKELHSVTASYSRVFILVDALDECGISDEGCSIFLSHIFSLQAKSRANIFATSRFIRTIENEFEGRSIQREIRASYSDVQKYLTGRLENFRPMVSKDPSLQGEIKSRIAKAVNGMFLLARLYVDSLAYKTTPKAIRLALNDLEIDSTTTSDSRKSRALDRAYTQAMDRINAQAAELKELARQVLSWITCAKRALTSSELQHALAVEVSEPRLDRENIPYIEDMVSVCAGLVTVDKESDIVRLVHYTTQEYFERTSSTWFPNAHADITKTCVTYLSFDIFGTGPSPSETDFKARVQSNILYPYAAQNWGDHARISSIGAETLILDFLESETKVSACIQAMTARRGYLDYNSTQITGIHLAAFFGLQESMTALLDRKHDPNCMDIAYRTTLSWAVWNRHKGVVKVLLDRGADIESKDKINGQTPLLLAVRNRHEGAVKLLLDKGANIESNDIFGQTPLSWAAEKGHEEIVKLLLGRGADIESKDKIDGQTPLLSAAQKGHEEIVKLLLDKGADFTVVDSCNSDRTVMSWAMEHRLRTIAGLLINKGDEVDQSDKYGRKVISWAAAHGHSDIVKLLLDKGVDCAEEGHPGGSPLWWATENGHSHIIKLLIGLRLQMQGMVVRLDAMNLDGAKAILCHAFSINLEWASTAEEMRPTGFYIGMDKMVRRFKWTWTICAVLSGGKLADVCRNEVG
ncbi:uncharacterized protein NFIA_077420 [Aspergillus fischeri NRRL 181]|uniref:Ankyrin repeat protein n=1 Tax=Neosartorya fischeri (strain ATCC 1020 / DSM 3700 / CBS 544.65 / FGSC A1164 / JCM 1740 / NRRL 181 / WB 181) TaxID=331117 RepID=A1DEJ9_NEOFI|nr:Ankyrin repeat protein [Aspergillus fischeri NRRL 181]EAW17806.1 Ankyrin repeat protein [Aspergillus fischeri NRRL 181]